MKKFFISLLAMSTITMGGLSVYAEELNPSNSEIMEAGTKELYHSLDTGSVKDMEEYTESENENDGLNTVPGFEPIISGDATQLINPLQENSPQFTIFGAGEWDYITYDYINTGASKIVSSYGGDFMFLIDQPYIGPGFTWMYKVYEDDGTIGDDVVGTFTLANHGDPQSAIVNARNYIDGDNNKAEFYIQKMTVPTQQVYVEFYD